MDIVEVHLRNAVEVEILKTNPTLLRRPPIAVKGISLTRCEARESETAFVDEIGPDGPVGIDLQHSALAVVQR